MRSVYWFLETRLLVKTPGVLERMSSLGFIPPVAISRFFLRDESSMVLFGTVLLTALDGCFAILS